MKWIRWRWLDDGFLPLAMLVMRAGALWLWLAVAQYFLWPSSSEPLLPVWLLAALLLGATAVTRVLHHSPASLTVSRAIVGALGVLLLFAALWWRLYRPAHSLVNPAWMLQWWSDMIGWEGEIPAAYLLVPAFIYLWLRGSVEGSRVPEHRDVMRALITGTVGLAVLMLISAFDPASLPEETAAVILLFYTMAMVALALAGYRALRRHLNASGEDGQRPVNRYWLGNVVTAIAAVLLVALLVNAFLAPELLSQIASLSWRLFSAALILVIKVVSFILYPVLLLLASLIPRLARGANELLERFAAGAELPQFDGEPPPPDAAAEDLLVTLETLPDAWRWVILLVAALLLGLLIAALVRRFVVDEEADVGEEREFILSAQLLLDQLTALFPWRPAPARALLRFLPLTGVAGTRRAIRALYRDLLTAAHRAGKPRARHETPSEWGQVLAETWPGGDEALAALTTRYMQARYDERPPTAEEADEARRHWERLAPFADGRAPEENTP